MIAVRKEVRQQIAVKRILRLQKSSYSQVHRYFTCDKFVRQLSNSAHLYPSCQSASALRYQLLGTKKQISSQGEYRKIFSSALMSSSADHGEASLGVNDVSEFEEVSFEHTIDAETDDDLGYLRVKLYDLSDSDDKTKAYLEKLYEAASIQQAFDVVDELENLKDGDSLKIASQALVTIWDLQKLLFKISANFDPERDFFDKPTFIEKVSRHPIFLEKIVKPVIENCEMLEDEPLVASLLCLKRMNYHIKGLECQKFIEECLRRCNTLSLPAISRLFVCMRTESLYGWVVCAQFFPLLSTCIDTMSTDIEVRLVAISLRNTLRIVSDAMIDKFRTKIATLADEIQNWETVTLCKVFLLLMACRNSGSDSKHVFDLIGEHLVSRVPTMQLMELLSLQRFLELGYIHPYSLVDALVTRMMRIVQEGVSSSCSPRLDLLASVAPHLKSAEQRRQLAMMLQNYLENHDFQLASGILFIILRWAKSNDTKLYGLFWSKAAKMVEKSLKEKVLERRILRLGRDYVNFVYGLNFRYRNKDFEFITKRYMYQLLENYENGTQPCILHPGDFSRCFAFLIGCASLSDPMFYDIEMLRSLDDFAPQFRSADIVMLSRGLESVLINLFQSKRPLAKYYDRVLEISSILEEQCSRILVDNQQNLEFGELLSIHKSALVTRRIKGESPILDLTMQRMMQCEIGDSRSMKDLAQHLINGWNNYPEAIEKIEDFIWNSRGSAVSPELIEKFVVAAFCLGWEVSSDRDAFEFCGETLTKGWDKLSFLGLLQSSLALCFYRRMSKELVHNIFSVEFLDQLDGELATSYRSNPLKLRQAMMELNRAVCIDMPDVNLPWFHEKFCEELRSMSKFQEIYLHKEVRKVLAEVVGDEAAVQANICSPYYYNLDFLIEFDKKNRPIRKNPRSSVGFFKKLRENADSNEVGRKVAVLILTPSSFTKSVRSLKGQLKLRRRHLEILGYDVVEIDPMYWNSMFMSENAVRHNFLEAQLYAKACAVG